MKRRLVLGLVTMLLACNGTTPPPAVPPGAAPDGTVADSDQGSAVMAGETVDVSPVPAPGSVVLHMRWNNPKETLDAIGSYAKLPPEVVRDLPRELVRGLLDEAIAGQVDVEAFSEIVALDAPLDGVVIADMSQGGQIPEPIVAISIGLTSIERALSASKGRPKKLGNGVWRVGTQDKDGDPCAVVAAGGKAPARLVCTESESQLTKVAPFVARNVATLPDPPEDLSAKVDLRPIFDKYGRNWANQARGLPVIAEEFKNGIPAFDEALMKTADALAQEAGALIQDADTVTLGANFDPKKGFDVVLEMQFAGKRSWIVQSLLDGADKQGPPPPLFWKLPNDVTTASFGRSGDPALLEPVLKTLRTLLEGKLEEEKIGTSADRQAFSKLLRVPFGKHVTFVSASGHFSGAPKPSQSAMAAVLGSSVGWYVMGVDEPSAKLRAWLDDLQKAFNRPFVQNELKKVLGSDAKNLPVVKVVPAPRALGPGGYDLKIEIPNLEEPAIDPDAKPKTVDVELHLLVMNDGNQSWVGFAADRDALAELMAKLKGAGPSPSLAAHPGLKHLQNEKHASVSIFTLGGLVDSLKEVMTSLGSLDPTPAETQKILSIFEQMPNKGQSPIIGLVDVDDGAKPRVRMKLNVPSATLQDVGYIVTKLIELDAKGP